MRLIYGEEKQITSILIGEKGFHSLIFVLDEGNWPRSNVGFTNDKFTKMYHTFMSLDGLLFSGRGRDFHTT